MLTFVSTQNSTTDGDGVLAAHRAAPGEPEPGDHGRLQPADERAGGGSGCAHPAGGQGVVLLESQQPGDLARVSPDGKHALRGDDRPDRNPVLDRSVRRRRRSTSPSGPRRRRPRHQSRHRRSILSSSVRMAPPARCCTRRTVRWSALPGSCPRCDCDVQRATPSLSVTPATPSASATPTPEGVITEAPDTPGALVEYPAAGTPVQLGSQASAAAFSPNQRYLATAVADGNGGSKIYASQSNGQQQEKLAGSAKPGHRADVGLERHHRVHRRHEHLLGRPSRAQKTLYTLAAGSGTITALAPGGAYAYVMPATGGDGSLLNWSTTTEQTLQGANDDVAFSGDGQTVAWIDKSSTPNRLLTEAVGSQSTPTMVTPPEPAATPSDVTLDQNGKEVGVSEHHHCRRHRAGRRADGRWHAARNHAAGECVGADALAWRWLRLHSSRRRRPAQASSWRPSPAPAPAPPARRSRPAPMPRCSNSCRRRSARAVSPTSTRSRRSAPQTSMPASSTPQNLSRAYIINTYLEPDGGVQASIELIVDPNASHTTARVANETLTLTSRLVRQLHRHSGSHHATP